MARYTRRAPARARGRTSYAPRGRTTGRRSYARARPATRGRTTRSRAAAPQTIRIVLEQPRHSELARPGTPVGLNTMIAAHKRNTPKL